MSREVENPDHIKIWSGLASTNPSTFSVILNAGFYVPAQKRDSLSFPYPSLHESKYITCPGSLFGDWYIVACKKEVFSCAQLTFDRLLPLHYWFC
jgi:hypothetical protein